MLLEIVRDSIESYRIAVEVSHTKFPSGASTIVDPSPSMSHELAKFKIHGKPNTPITVPRESPYTP